MDQQNQSDLFKDLTLDETAKQHIRGMASWAMTVVVIAVIGYVISIFQLFQTRPVRSAELFDLKNFGMQGGDMAGSIVVILVGMLINFFLFRFASQAKTAVDGLNQQQLNSSFNNLRIYFMITTIIFILCFVLLLLGVGFGATKAATI